MTCRTRSWSTASPRRRQELFNLRFQSVTGALENSARLKLAKREIARILTVVNERESEKAKAS